MERPGSEPLVAMVRASCPSCGDVEMPASALTARLCATTDEGSYTFQCPECTGAVVKPADKRLLDLLVASGIPLLTWSLPSELVEAHDGAPINYDDVLAFHELLATDDWFDSLRALVDDDGRTAA